MNAASGASSVSEPMCARCACCPCKPASGLFAPPACCCSTMLQPIVSLLPFGSSCVLQACIMAVGGSRQVAYMAGGRPATKTQMTVTLSGTRWGLVIGSAEQQNRGCNVQARRFAPCHACRPCSHWTRCCCLWQSRAQQVIDCPPHLGAHTCSSFSCSRQPGVRRRGGVPVPGRLLAPHGQPLQSVPVTGRPSSCCHSMAGSHGPFSFPSQHTNICLVGTPFPFFYCPFLAASNNCRAPGA